MAIRRCRKSRAIVMDLGSKCGGPQALVSLWSHARRRPPVALAEPSVRRLVDEPPG
jgi:hypothetical protein